MEENKVGFKSKVETFFSYYKWYILIALFFVVTISILVFQMCSKDEYEINVMYAGNAILSDSASANIESSLETIGNDGEKAVFYELLIMNEEQINQAYLNGYTQITVSPEKDRQNRETFALNVLGDQYFILMLSPECYQIYRDNGALEKLDDILVAPNNPDIRADEYSIKLHSLDFVKSKAAFTALPSDTVLCFKKISEVNANRKAKQEQRAHDIEYFKKMVDYKSNAQGASVVMALPNGKEYLSL